MRKTSNSQKVLLVFHRVVTTSQVDWRFLKFFMKGISHQSLRRCHRGTYLEIFWPFEIFLKIYR